MASKLQGKWVKIDQEDTGDGINPGARSSHGIAVVGDKMYLFGGEFTSAIPIDNNLYVFDLKTRTWSIAPAIGDVPTPRLGTDMVVFGSNIYIFGGYDDVSKDHLNDFYVYDTNTNEWKRLSSGDPELLVRSYHSTAADNQNIYVFGGCSIGSRLKTLHGYNVNENKWIQYPTPDKSFAIRGGAGLAVVNRKIWVVYGFNNVEMDDIHYLDLPTGQWTQVETTGEKPTARSVFATAVVGKHILVFGGEIEPSPLLHDGAGIFSDEIYGLNTETLVWKKWEGGPMEEQPSPRGWCAFTTAVKDGKEGLLLHGGNSASNDRLDDIYFFTPYQF